MGLILLTLGVINIEKVFNAYIYIHMRGGLINDEGSLILWDVSDVCTQFMD